MIDYKFPERSEEYNNKLERQAEPGQGTEAEREVALEKFARHEEALKKDK